LQELDTAHRTDHWTYICDSGNTAQTQACSAPLLHIGPKWYDSGTEAVPTSTVLCDRSEQGSRPDTAEGGLVWCESIHSHTDSCISGSAVPEIKVTSWCRHGQAICTMDVLWQTM